MTTTGGHMNSQREAFEKANPKPENVWWSGERGRYVGVSGNLQTTANYQGRWEGWQAATEQGVGESLAWRESLQELVDAMHNYEMDVEDGPPYKHRAMMDRARAVLAQPTGGEPAHPDDIAVDNFAQAMKEKMAASRAKGRHGWQKCAPEYLCELLVEHLTKGNAGTFVDVANFAMMLDQNKASPEVLREVAYKPTGGGVPEYNWLDLLEDECWDIRCVPEHNHDDADVAWIVIEHHMSEPNEREIGRGKTPLLALLATTQQPPEQE